MADPKDIKKSVEETVNQILSAEANGGATQQIADPTAQADAANKAMPNSSPANGGKDAIRSGSPMTEEEKAEEAKKAKAAEEDKEKKRKEEDEAKKAMSDDEDKKKKDKEAADKAAACKSKMKKSIDELKDHLDDEELELIKAWREESDKEAVAKSQSAAAPASQAIAAPTIEQITEVLKKTVAESTADLRKAMDEKDTLIKGLNDKIEKMASQPAYDRRSISTLETLEKSGSNGSGELTKSQVLDKMLELQAAGKGVTSHHIAEFEATRNISDPTVRGIVFRELKVNQ